MSIDPEADPKFPRRLREAISPTYQETDQWLSDFGARQALLSQRWDEINQAENPDRDQLAAFGREIEALHTEFEDRQRRLHGLPGDPFPSNPVIVRNTLERTVADYARWFEPNHIYLDVTDARLEDVGEIWTIVEWHKARLRQRGLTAARARGTPKGPRSGSKVDRWVQRAQEIGEEDARAEFKAETPDGRGEWQSRSKWWRDKVRPHLRKA